MKERSLKEIGRIFKQFGEKIETGTCGVDIDTLNDIASKMLHIKLNAEQTCRFLNCSRATLSRMINDGRVPRPYREAGGKEYWYQDELEDYISKQ
jgi:predicted DNA-binding transcriptional regulator AlpA